MGKLTIGEMHNSLYDYAQAVSDESLLTENKTIVGAINEIYGKQLIADAIGEPLTATDTFNEMSNDINTLLSSFKANMMNAGVVVNSGDRFKTLIEKIKGLTEGEGNKGIQFASGDLSSSELSVSNFSYIYETTSSISSASGDFQCIGLNYFDFIPSIVILKFSTRPSTGSGTPRENYAVFDTIINNDYMYTTYTANNSTLTYTTIKFNNVMDKNPIVLPLYISGSTLINDNIQYYAIGVGEEDTTLRDSLADILENKGVDVTEEDDMASLITKIDSIGGGLDIISATELPATGKENQICVITDNPEGPFLLTSVESDTVDNGFLVYLNNNSTATPINITRNNITENYRISYIKQGTQYLATYIWSNSTWNTLLNACLILLEDGVFKNDDISGGFNTGTYHYMKNNALYMATDSNNVYYSRASFKKQIDFTYYKTLRITAKSANSKSIALRLYSGSACTSSRPSGQSGSKAVAMTVTSSEQTCDFDISNWTGLGCLNLEAGHESGVYGIYVYYIELF